MATGSFSKNIRSVDSCGPEAGPLYSQAGAKTRFAMGIQRYIEQCTRGFRGRSDADLKAAAIGTVPFYKNLGVGGIFYGFQPKIQLVLPLNDNIHKRVVVGEV